MIINSSPNLYHKINMELDTIIINNKSFFVTKYAIQVCPFIERYFTVLWENKDPIVLQHPYFEITETDITQVFSLIDIIRLLNQNERRLEYHDTHIDNVVIAAFIIDYFGCDIAIPFLDDYVKIHHNIPPLLLFLYKPELCIKSLEEADLTLLLQWGDHKFENLIQHVANDIILDIHSYTQYMTPFDLDIGYKNDFTDPYYNCAVQLQLASIVSQMMIPIPYFPPQMTLPVIPNVIPLIQDNPINITHTFNNLTLNECKSSLNIPKFIPSPYKVHEIDQLTVLGRSFKHNIPCGNPVPNLVSKDNVLKRLDILTEGMLLGITWDHVVLAGGSVSLALCDYDLTDDHYTASDLDLFVWGPDREMVINRLISELRSKLDIVVCQRGRVCTIVVRNQTRNIQIIDNHHDSLFNILNAFDFTTAMAAYDGSHFIVTPEYMFAIMTHTTFSKQNPISLHRICKNLLRGFNVLIDDRSVIKGNEEYDLEKLNNIDIMEESSTVHNLNKYVFATKTESESRLIVMIRSLFGKEYNLLKGNYVSNSDKDWKSDYDKVNLDNTELKLENRSFSIGSDYNRNTINMCYAVNCLRQKVSIKLYGVTVIGCRETLIPDSINLWRFSLVVLLNKDHEESLLPYRRLFSSISNAKMYMSVRHEKDKMIRIYKRSYHSDEMQHDEPLIYPNIKRNNSYRHMTNCYRGKTLLTVSDCHSLTQRHSLYGDIIISPYVIFNNSCSISFELKSFHMKHKCEASSVI